MKARWISIPIAILMFIGVGPTLTTRALLSEPLSSAAQSTNTLAPEALAEKSGCLECHSIDKKKIGPAYHDVAAKYKDDPNAREALVRLVKKGGKGNWLKVTGGSPMPSFERRISDAEIRRLVDWVLSQ